MDRLYVLAIAILATICVAVCELYEFTVSPVPLNDKVEVDWKLLPLTVKLLMVCP